MIPFAVPPAAGRSVSFVAAGVAGTSTDIGALPVGWSPGQVAIFTIASYNGSSLTIPSHGLPAGWTLIGSATDTDSDAGDTAFRISVYRRRLVALDTDPQATATGATNSDTGIITYSGVHASTPTEGATTANNAADGGAPPAYLTITTTGPNRMLVQAVGGVMLAGTPGFYWTERLDVSGITTRFRVDDRRVYPSGTHPPVTSPSATSGVLLANVAFALIPA
jgi:hypothetical protein